MWYRSKYVQYAIPILLTLLIIYLGIQLLPSLQPIFNFLLVFFSPLIFGIILYYMFRPLMSYLLQHGVPFWAGILMIFGILASVLALLGTYVAPLIIQPIQKVAEAPGERIEQVKEATVGFFNIFNVNLYSQAEMREILGNFAKEAQAYFLRNTYSFVLTLTHIAFMFIITPFALFYLLRDGKKMHQWFLELIPPNNVEQVDKMLMHLDDILGTFLNGQIIVASAVTVLAMIGLGILGIGNWVFLVFITFLLALIPYLGTLLAIIPPFLMGLTDSTLTGFVAGGIMVAIHAIESNLITPHVMMSRLDVHPLTVILLIVASFSFFGISGPIWITPVYIFLREVVTQLIDFYASSTEASQSPKAKQSD